MGCRGFPWMWKNPGTPFLWSPGSRCPGKRGLRLLPVGVAAWALCGVEMLGETVVDVEGAQSDVGSGLRNRE
jgi:hypothetical protein